jgi:hypothetical protein
MFRTLLVNMNEQDVAVGNTGKDLPKENRNRAREP